MRVLRTIDDFQAWRPPASGASGVLVPTMGALHEGHASLIRQAATLAQARRDAAGCVVSIFVNPTQFNDRSDYDRYPRTEEADLARCEGAGASAVFIPSSEVVYPPKSTPPVPPLPAVATEPGLEDAHRPGHFAGVCQVVLRLFTLVRPAAAVFGEKDWQQLQVVRAMTERSGLGIEVVPGPTVRDPDALAQSSRNRFLTVEDREKALSIPLALARAAAEGTVSDGERAMAATLREAGITPDYAVIRDARSLGPVNAASGEARALIAGRVGAVRLIDNAPWKPRRPV